MSAKIEKIVKIEELPETEEYVYDLEVDDCHTFMANDIFVHNTDSIFILIGDHTYADIQKLADVITKEISEWLVKEYNIENSTLELEFEKVYKTIIYAKSNKGSMDIAAKKKYAGHLIYKDGKEVDKISIMGFENRRSDYPQIIRDFQVELFNLILRGKLQPEVDEYVDAFVKKFKNSPAQDISFIKGLQKDFIDYKSNIPIHVRAAMLSNQRHGTNFKKGDKIKFVYVTECPHGVQFENVIAFDNKIPDGYKIDYKHMTDNLIWGRIISIYESIGWARSTDGTKSLFDYYPQKA